MYGVSVMNEDLLLRIRGVLSARPNFSPTEEQIDELVSSFEEDVDMMCHGEEIPEEIFDDDFRC